MQQVGIKAAPRSTANGADCRLKMGTRSFHTIKPHNVVLHIIIIIVFRRASNVKRTQSTQIRGSGGAINYYIVLRYKINIRIVIINYYCYFLRSSLL